MRVVKGRLRPQSAGKVGRMPLGYGADENNSGLQATWVALIRANHLLTINELVNRDELRKTK